VGVVHQRVELAVPLELAVEVVKQPVERLLGDADAVLLEALVEFRPERSLGVVVDLLAVEKRVTDLVEQPVEQPLFQVRQRRLDDVVVVFALLGVVVDRDEGEGTFSQ